MDSNLFSLIPAITIIFNVCISVIPGILLKIYTDSNIPKDLVKFKESYEEKIDKIEHYSLAEVSKSFENAVENNKNSDEDSNEEDKEEDYLKQLSFHKVLFSDLNKYNVKQYEHDQVLKKYDCVKHFQDNFYKFYLFTLALAALTTLIIVYNNGLFLLIIVVFFPFVEAMRSLYNLKHTHKQIKICVNSIEKDYKKASFFNF